MPTAFGLALACVAAISAQIPAQPAHSDRQAMDRKLRWQTTIAALDPRLDAKEFRIAISRLRDSDIHVSRYGTGSVGWSVICGSWAGISVPLDEDWTAVRESANADASVKPDELSIPVPENSKMIVRVVGLADVRARVDPAFWESVRIIHRSPKVPDDFDPVNLIRAVNALQAMGEERAFESMRAYYKLCGDAGCQQWLALDRERIIWIARLLYLPREGNPSISRPALGAANVVAAPGSLIDQFFPLALQDDVPFCLVSSFVLNGVPEDPLDYITRCRKEGQFREVPLRPTADPISAADSLSNTAITNGLKVSLFVTRGGDVCLDQVRTLVRGQALAAARIKTTAERKNLFEDEPLTEDDWRDAQNEARTSRMVWKTKSNDFAPWTK